ncbi:hypothetical protein RHECNPAF_79004 [Rhizobium etli CNPAF512]|nr:hypothetical protein RHECNPAF_79004 [Rhizobium etli CNPAF512]
MGSVTAAHVRISFRVLQTTPSAARSTPGTSVEEAWDHGPITVDNGRFSHTFRSTGLVLETLSDNFC